MTQLPHSIELHDSEVSNIEIIKGHAHIFFAPAYIHKDGKGWLQNIEVVICNAKIFNAQHTFPVKIYDGHMKTELGLYHNLLEIPFSTKGEVIIELELENGHTTKIIGSGIEHHFRAEATFLEQC